MGYNAGEGVLDYSYCEEDIVNSAKSNIRGFIQIIIGIAIALALLSFLLSTLGGVFSCLGGCFGCEACIETAACADDCSCADCDYESMTAEQVDKANARVSCDGYDCCGKEGCLACGGCGDCSQCRGYEYDTITVVIEGVRVERKLLADATYLSFAWPDGMTEPYYKCLGLFDEDGTLYVTGSGSIKKELKDGLVLYAKFEEVNVGVQYELHFDLSELNMEDVRFAVTVGGEMPTFPSVPEKEGYVFKGWYKDAYYITDGTDLPSTFHLQNFRMSPNGSSRVCTLRPKYEARKHEVQFYVRGDYCTTITMPYETPMRDVYAKFYSEYYDYTQNETFFGWATGSDANPDNEVVGDVLLTKDMSVYAIIHEAVWLYFVQNTDDWYDSSFIEIKFIEGTTNIVFDDIERLDVFKDESMRPGYKFVGWYTTDNPGPYDQAVTSIDRLETTTHKYYYAKWEKATYTLTYWAMDHKAGELKSVAIEYYSMGDEYAFWDKIEDPVGYEFAGWCFDEACLGNVYTGYLPTDTYGNTNLYAKFIPDAYHVTLIAPGGYFNADYTGSNLGGDTIAYGSKDNINKAYREGYDFVGWFYGDLETGEGDQLTDANGDLLQPFTLASLGLAVTETNEAKINKEFTLFAKWTIKVFEVEFVSEGMTYETCYVEWGKTITRTKTEAPEKEGHTFRYWTYENGDRYYDTHIIKDGPNGVVVDGKVVLSANFEINKYTVTFVIDGTPYEVKNVQWNTLLGVADDRLSEPTYNGTPRRRAGWFTTEDFETEMEEDEPITSNITLYAKYDYAKKFTFHGASGNQEIHYFVGDRETFPTDYKKGYTFEGWCDDSSLSSTPVLENVWIRETTPTEYYPKHTTITYNIEYYLSPSDARAWKTDTYTVEDVKDLIAFGDSDAPEKTGYTFDGWKWNGNQITQLAHMTEDKKLYAIFNANTYVVTLRQEGNDVVKTATYDGSFDFGTPSSDKEGYDFVGWSWERGASETQVVTDNTGKSLPGVVYKTADDTDAYPVFRVKQYSAFWMDPDGEKIIEQTVIRHFEYVQKPTDPIKEGYTFRGWYKDKDCTQEYDFYESKVTGDVTVWAKFTINSYSVTFVVDTGLQYVAENLVYNTSLETAMKNAQSTVDAFVDRTKARFVNWLTKDGAIYTADDVVPAKNLTLTAKFHMPITVHYELHDDTEHDAGLYYAGDSIPEYSYSRKGYTFEGWYTTSNTKQSFPIRADENTPEDIYLYARWKANTYRIHYYVDSTYTYSETYTTNETQDYGGFALWTPTAVAGKEFKGWYIGSYGSGTPIDALDNYDLSDDEMRVGDLYLYGRWEEIEYSVKFFIDGVEQTSHELKYKNGDFLYTLGWTPTVPEGKTFLGWRIKGTQTLVIDGSGNWSNSNYNWEKDLELEAWFI